MTVRCGGPDTLCRERLDQDGEEQGQEEATHCTPFQKKEVVKTEALGRAAVSWIRLSE
jgi:hypothetical protein